MIINIKTRNKLRTENCEYKRDSQFSERFGTGRIITKFSCESSRFILEDGQFFIGRSVNNFKIFNHINFIYSLEITKYYVKMKSYTIK
ncbi:hypothetical protein DERP_014785 [Dermatophagoides pteronyssinus]|uniref:Uncharacterized protein n=1 Tax=Dermatophagoides pteronyssinus TaxID=6956 RepID=A0ABQ8J2E6_DERPT|nr:hypothetical protein DERP_014785 [Dermatophagoides pteronyssinus]